ncbi:MAG: hypothetical protein PF572_01345 [Patescibacteria group bacterium]|jgi:hypothetical protein|nr:hypothetical protein [Patescibacteria group bacterium]
MQKFQKKFTLAVLLLTFLVLPLSSFAEMRSSNYVIYENLLHTFNGPAISSISSSVSANIATVTWSTDVPSNSYVIYDDNISFTASHEQGNGGESVTSHSISIVGLDWSTTYYYRVKSKSPNGDQTLSGINSFSVGSDPTPPASSGGGGVLIIDKTDKFGPEISDIQIASITKDSAEITWTTNEESTSFVEYGFDTTYGNTKGQWDALLEHRVVLISLKADTEYSFRVLSSDDWGNVAYSENNIFKTLIDEDNMVDTDDDGIVDTVIPPDDLDSLLKKAVEIMDSMAGTISTEVLKDKLENPYNSLDKLASFIPAPIFNADPRVEIDAKKATVYWRTNIDASGLVALASEMDYNPNSENPYNRVIGDPEQLSQDHQLELFGLEPNTTYHYQLRSKAEIGPMAATSDYTFTTSIETIEISNFFSQVVDDNEAIFKWITNKESNSTVKYTPYRGNMLAIEETKEQKENIKTVIHEMTVSDFQPGIIYNVKIESEDINGNVATEIIDPFSTSEDDFPPEISQIKTNSSISSDREARTQTVISWITNEPATTRIYYMEGVHGPNVELSGSTEVNNDYSKDHISLFTEFSAGTVYTFRVESIDSGGNETLSDPHTFMTPKKSESIIDVIIRVLEDTFGWVKEIMK